MGVDLSSRNEPGAVKDKAVTIAGKRGELEDLAEQEIHFLLGVNCSTSVLSPSSFLELVSLAPEFRKRRISWVLLRTWNIKMKSI